MPARLAAVSVDLDEVGEYTRIHGLAPLQDGDPAAHAVYDRALARIEAWAAALAIPVTFFAIGRDLARAENAAALRRLTGRGHAVESHSLSHRYDLSRLPAEEIAREVQGGADAVEAATGVRPAGFRAPGYTVSETLFDALAEAGVAFDSSVFPSPVYLAAKAAVLAWMRLRGRASASILDAPGVLRAPRAPYRPGRRARPFVELPILVTPVVGFPVIGTSVGRAGVRGARLLAGMCAADPFANLELHGMDFLEGDDLVGANDVAPAGPPAAPHPLARLQPELHASLSSRLDSLTAFVERLRERGFTFVTLAEAAARWARTV